MCLHHLTKIPKRFETGKPATVYKVVQYTVASREKGAYYTLIQHSNKMFIINETQRSTDGVLPTFNYVTYLHERYDCGFHCLMTYTDAKALKHQVEKIFGRDRITILKCEGSDFVAAGEEEWGLPDGARLPVIVCKEIKPVKEIEDESL